MKTKMLFMTVLLAACLTACGSITTETDSLDGDVPATSETVSETTEDEGTCPFADYTSSPVRVTIPAYAPYLLEVDEQTASQLHDAFVNASWELLPSDTPYPDGESYLVFVYNDGQPFKLVFYGDHTVDYEHGDTTERYQVDDASVHQMVYNAADLGERFDTLIWCAPEFLTNEKVWNEHHYQHIEIEPQSKPSFGFSFELPDSLTYEIVETEDEPTGHLTAEIRPKDSDASIITVEYTEQFAVCGTGLERKTIDFNGYPAAQGFYDGSDMWSFIALTEDYDGCVILMNDPDLFTQYADEMDIILQTLHFRYYESTQTAEVQGERTIEELKALYPDFFSIDGTPFKGIEVYVWQMSEDSFSCGLMFGTNRNKTAEEIWELQERALSVDEVNAILDEIGVEKSYVIVYPVIQPVSSYYYEIDDEYRETVSKLFEEEGSIIGIRDPLMIEEEEP